MTNFYRVYVDPPSGGIDLKVTMTRADADDNWPMVLFLYSLPSLPNDYCSRGANGDMSCCWPYSDGAAGEPEAVCPLRDGDTLALAAGVLILGNTKEIVHRISARGHYLISAKSYGYGGGDYIIQAVLENGATVNPSSTSDADMVPGPIKYGDTVVSQIKHSGQVDEWTFQGEKGDLIDVTMSPDFAPMTDDQGNSPVMSRCGKPYGKGLVCLDTYLMLVAPSGKLEEANHEAARGKAWGSHIGTKIRPIDPFGTETGWGGPFLSLEAGQHMLMETGTYTIKATGMVISNDKEKRSRYGIGPVGGYYLQLASYGKHSGVLPPECPRLPPDAVKGFDGVPGCANFQWGGGANPARPRMDKRHPNCEKFFPQAPLIGGNTAVDEPQIRNWKIHKTGKYIARVRPLKNNCFLSKVYGYYWSQFVCHANAGPYDIKLRVRDTPKFPPAPAPGYVPSPPPPLAAGADVMDMEIGASVPITHQCGADLYGSATGARVATTGATGACYKPKGEANVCDSVNKYVDSSLDYLYKPWTPRDDSAPNVEVAKVRFTASAGDVLCIAADVATDFATNPPTKPQDGSVFNTIPDLQGLELYYEQGVGSGKLAIMAHERFHDYSTVKGPGLHIHGFKAPKSGTYEAWVYSGSGSMLVQTYDPNTYDYVFHAKHGITVRKCPTELKTTSDAADSCDQRTFVSEAKMDDCIVDDISGGSISADGLTVTMENEAELRTFISKLAIPVGDDALDKANGKFYWEATPHGDLGANLGQEPYKKYYNTLRMDFGFGTRDFEEGCCGDQKVTRKVSTCGRRAGRSGGLTKKKLDPGDALGFMPGDTAGMAFDAGAECAGGTCVFDRIKYAISRNGTWLSPSGCGHNLAGTEFNQYPPYLSADGQPGQCTIDRNREVRWPADARTPAAEITQYGDDMCPAVTLNNYVCPHSDSFGYSMGKSWTAHRPSCCPPDPSATGECASRGQHHMYDVLKSDVAKFKPDPFTSKQMVYPLIRFQGAASPTAATKNAVTFNFGADPAKPFKSRIPCGYRPAHALVSATYIPPATTNCEACRGECKTFDLATSTCTEYAAGAGAFPYEKYGMLKPGDPGFIVWEAGSIKCMYPLPGKSVGETIGHGSGASVVPACP